MIQSRTIISLSVFSSLGLLGLLFPAVGASLPAIEKYYNISLSSSGIITSLVQLGYALFCFLGGLLSDYFSKQKVLVAGTFLYGLSGILLAYSQNWYLNLVLFFLIGTGSGLIFIASNTLVIDIFNSRRGRFLNIHHTFFALGSLSSPLIVSSLLLKGLPWSRVFQLFGLFSIILGLLLIFSDISSHVSNQSVSGTNRNIAGLRQYRKVLLQKKFIKLLVIGFLVLGVQFGIIYLLVSFLVKVRFIVHHDASLIMTAFFALLLIGRLICSYLVSRYSAVNVILILLLSLSVTLTMGWITNGIVSQCFFALTGLASSGLMPTLLALASSILPTNVRGVSLGFISMAGGLGGMVVTLTVSGLAKYVGFNTSFLLLILLSLISTIYFIKIRHEF